MKEDNGLIKRLLSAGLGLILILLSGLSLQLSREIHGLAEYIQSLALQLDLLSDGENLVHENLFMLKETLIQSTSQNRLLLESMSERLTNRAIQKDYSESEPEQNQPQSLSHSEFPNHFGERVNALDTLSHSPYNMEALIFLGRNSYEEGDLEQALGYFSRVIEVDPGNREACLSAARAAYGLKDYSRALIFGRNLVNQEERPEYWLFLARCYQQLEDYDQSLNGVNRALHLDRNNLDALELGGQISFVSEDYDGAMDYYSRAAELEPRASYFLALGDLSYRTCSKEQAYRFWSMAAHAEPVRTREEQDAQLDLYEKLALCAYEMGDKARLEDCFFHAGRLGGRESIHILMVRREKDLNHPGEALKRVGEFRKKYPQSPFEDELIRISNWAKGD